MKDNDKVLFKDFNFTLNDGDKAVIIGEEGNGKSTLLKMIYDENLIKDYCKFSGDVVKNNLKLGYLSQETNDEINNMPVNALVNEEFIYDLSKFRNMNMDKELLISDRMFSTLSGGEKIKIRLVSILENDPDILLLDEPTNDLDLETQKWIENFIAFSRIPVLFVSHDETLIQKAANVIIHIERVKRKTEFRYSIARMKYSEYVNRRSMTLEKQEQIARKQKSDYKKQMQQWQNIYNSVDYKLDTITRADPGGARLLKKKMKALKSQQKRLQRNSESFYEIPDVEDAIDFNFNYDINIPNGKTIIDISLDKLYAGDKLLSSGIRLNVTGPQHVAVIGDNGAGKSTLLKYIKGIVSCNSSLRVGYMPQNYDEILDNEMTPIDFLAPDRKKGNVTKAYTYMGSMKLTADEMNNKIGMLSGGQKAKLIFLHLILNDFDLLLLDEPTRNFSPLSSPVVREACRNFKGAIISVSHDRKFIEDVCPKIYLLDKSGLHAKNKDNI